MENESPYGKILIEIELGLWEHDARVEDINAPPYEYTDKHLRAAMKIFTSVMLWKLWEKRGFKTLLEQSDSATELGNEIRALVLKYADVDSRKFY